MKTIVIDGKEYEIECNALTYIQYKKIFKRGIFEDMEIVKNYLILQTLKTKEIKEKNPQASEEILDNEVSNFMNKYIDDFIEAITKLAYIMIYSANEKVVEYEKWLRNIKKLKIDDDWIAEVTEFAVDCFC